MLLDVPLICQDFGCIYSQDSVCKLNVSNLLNIKVVFDGWVGGKERETSKNDELSHRMRDQTLIRDQCFSTVAPSGSASPFSRLDAVSTLVPSCSQPRLSVTS